MYRYLARGRRVLARRPLFYWLFVAVVAVAVGITTGSATPPPKPANLAASEPAVPAGTRGVSSANPRGLKLRQGDLVDVIGVATEVEVISVDGETVLLAVPEAAVSGVAQALADNLTSLALFARAPR